MIIEEILKKLLESNVKLSVKENKLLCKLPEGGIDNELLNMLKEYKEEIKELIQKKINFEKYQAIPYAPVMENYPLTPSQKRLWVLSQFEGGSQAYNMSFVIKLKGELNYAYFEQAFLKLIEQHEILRTQFKFDDDSQEVRQQIVDHTRIAFSVDKYDFAYSTDYDKKIEETLTEKMSEAFCLEHAPLLRASLFKIAEYEHVFFLNMHHIITDGWSMEILVSEVVQYYNDLLEGTDNKNLGQKIQYKDFAVWFEEEMKKEKYKKSEKYWLDKFSGNLATLTLPTFKQRPAIQTFNGTTVSHVFSSEFTRQIKSFSEVNNTTPFVTLMTIVKAILHRYSNQDDIIVGTPIAGREHPDLENKIGLFVNTLAIRTQFTEKTRFIDLLEIEKNNLVEANEHQMYGFDELVNGLGLKKELSRSALFDVMVVYQNQTLLDLGYKKEDVSNLTFEKFHLPKKTSQFDMTFNFSENDDKLKLSIEYNIDIYDYYLIERIFSHFENFFINSVKNPNTLIKDIDYLSNLEKNELLTVFNDSEVDYPIDKTIIDIFEQQVAKTPNNIAVVFEDKELTYNQLNEQVNQLAHYLRNKCTIVPNDLIGIKLDRSEKLIISILGILKSGAAYVPIDPSYPQERIDYIERDSNCKLIIDDAELIQYNEIQNQFSKDNLNKINKPNDLAYVIYTSGTTGKPKGTLLEHRNVVRLFFTEKPLFDFSDKDVWTLFHSHCFDFSVWEINGALLYGGKLIVVPKLIAQDTTAFLKLIDKHSVTVLNQTPSSFYNLINTDLVNDEKNGQLRYVIFGGEALNPTLLYDWNKKYQDTKLINMYGITETTVHVTFKEIGEKEILAGKSNIGIPIPTLKCHILDSNRNLVPIGVVGELCVSGLGVARGYLNMPELTNQRFIENPFDKNDRLYLSGDLAFRHPNGDLEYLGRKDQQVKIRGFRIELGDIENAILNYSEEFKQVVVDVKGSNQEKSLVAYLISDSKVDKSDLRTFLLDKLPDYMIPSYFVFLKELPLTSNGKVNREALPEVTGDDVILRTYVAPNNELEEKILSMVNQILPVKQDNIGVTDNFFEIGLNSLSVVKLTKIIKKDLEIELNPVDLFQFPNVKMLAEKILDNKEEENNEFFLNVSEDIDSMVDLF